MSFSGCCLSRCSTGSRGSALKVFSGANFHYGVLLCLSRYYQLVKIKNNIGSPGNVKKCGHASREMKIKKSRIFIPSCHHAMMG